VLLASLVALIVQAELGAAELIDQAQTALWWLAAAVLGGALALAAWWLERRGAAARAAAERERERAELEALRERELAAERERRLAELEDERRRHATELEGERARLTGQLENERTRLTAELEGERSRLTAELEGEKSRLTGELEGERSRLTSELEAERARHAQAEEAARAQHASELEAERSRLTAELEAVRAQLTDQVRERDDLLAQLRDQVSEHAAALEMAKDRAQRFSRRDERERDANRQLREQIAELQSQNGTLGDWQNIRELVLRMAMTLVEAEKGLLLTRDADGDGEIDETLELVAAEGFDGDAANSELAQRFGHETLERDKIIREDTPEDEPQSDASHADREIDNLVAIPIYIRDRFGGVVVCANRPDGFEELDDEVLLALGDQAGAALQNQRLHDELRRSYISTIRMLAEAIQAKDPFLRGHSEEVSDYVAAVAERLGLDGRAREQLIVGSLLHDVGKIGISERILHKPAKLTQEEFAVIQLHPRIGYRLIEQVPALRPIAAAILHHHERYDGGGYPTGLVGEQIPLEARIVCVADAFSAMTADRPYRARMALDDACEELQRHAGTQFDPEIVRIFVEEVQCRPPEHSDALANALDDAELQVHRQPDEPVLGAGAVALTDSVTLLYGHRYLHEIAAAEAERAAIQDRAFSILLVHIDEVEHVNEVDGYAAGDAHLRSCARALSRLAVRLGATACREGGLTLGLLVPASRDTDADVLAAEAREALRECGAMRLAVETWRPGDTGDAVIDRARVSLATQSEPTL
jgi:diguanylate cyclase (GGDEF)-like protein